MSQRPLHFTVDAQLLQELGERLVGRPYIALAELIKNAYDADATRVEISASHDCIVVSDNGHGMSEREFTDTWMRVGSTHKARQRTSRTLKREMTGSKGVGRLAVQLLARETTIVTAGGDGESGQRLEARVNWDAATREGDLTSVTVPVTIDSAGNPEFAGGSTTGTRVELRRLSQVWTASDFRHLAQEIWALQPPHDVDPDSPERFQIAFDSDLQDAYDAFSAQMRAILDIWSAQLTAKLVDVTEFQGTVVGDLPVRLSPSDDALPDLESSDDGPTGVRARELLPDRVLEVKVRLRGLETVTVGFLVRECQIDRMRCDIRVFTLQQRQAGKVKVSQARQYLERFGGIGVNDGAFRLPYYGPDQDWIDLEGSHSARRSTSRLLPAELNVTRGLLNLPTNRRVYGRVVINTAHEQRWFRRREQQRAASDTVMEPPLSIQITRDRLVPNDAYERMRVMVRAVMDVYAMEETKRRLDAARDKRRDDPPTPTDALADISTAVEEAAAHLPERTVREITAKVDAAARSVRALEESKREHAALMGALATAGISAMAYSHELSRQKIGLDDVVERLRSLLDDLPAGRHDDATVIVDDLDAWLRRAAGLRKLLEPVMDEETRKDEKPRGALAVLKGVRDTVTPVSRGIPIDLTAVPRDLKLPPASVAAWWAVLQNLFINSFNALFNAAHPAIAIDGGRDDAGRNFVRVQDNGIGVGSDLVEANRFFEPFRRKLNLPPESAALGLGGTGLGLTIVEMITEEVGARAQFTAPTTGFTTAVTISWEPR